MNKDKIAKVMYLFADKQLTPSQIDREMKLIPGEAHDAIVGRWYDHKTNKGKKDVWEL